ncbi:MAG: hypothetical protein EP335_17895 [Alphaproteobacteria bacterium]|nr:MAG: hypothetical protein EP335_17895 [Alphaproteobacteria bacterium]
MFNYSHLTGAQLADRFVGRSCGSMFMLALAYSLDVVGYATGQTGFLDTIRVALSIILVINLLPIYAAYISRRRATNCSTEDGYIVGMFKKAVVHAFTLNFIVMIFLEAVTEIYLTDIPTKIFLNGLLALTLLTLSISFFILTRDSDDEEDDLDLGEDA